MTPNGRELGAGNGWLVARTTALARSAAPYEAVALIAKGPEGVTLYEAANASSEPRTSFVVDPRDQLRILTAIDNAGEQLVGFFHSHPSSGAAPSIRDRELARQWPGVTWVIVGLNGDVDAEPEFSAEILCPE